MGYDKLGLGKRRQGISCPVVTTLWAKHEGLGFDGRSGNSITIKNFFVNATYMPELACLSGGVVVVNEGGSPLPSHTSCGKLKESDNEESSQTQPTLAFRESNKPINERKKKKAKGSTSNMTFLVCHRCKKRDHTIDICSYVETCSQCGKCKCVEPA